MNVALVKFLAMGGYAGYVWPAYGVFLLILLIDWLSASFHYRRLLLEERHRLTWKKAHQSHASHTLPPP